MDKGKVAKGVAGVLVGRKLLRGLLRVATVAATFKTLRGQDVPPPRARRRPRGGS